MIRIAHCSDLHYGPKNLAEADRCFGAAVDRAIALRAQVAVLSGDATDHALDLHAPSAERLARQVRRLADHCPVLMLQGTFSHEPPGTLALFRLLGGRHPVHVAGRIAQVGLTGDGRWVVSDCWRFDKVPAGVQALFSCVPTVNKAMVAAAMGASAAAEATGEQLSALLAGFAQGHRAARKQAAYTFCLLTTALRQRVLTGLESLPETEQEMALLFQICACMAAGGYFGGAVCSFGFPRQEGNAFLPALQAAYRRFGHGDVKTQIEAGHPNATKDGGIDVIAWRDHPDRLPAKLYSVGQCASGKNWKQKPVVSEMGQFHGTWFTTRPAEFCVPALYIPFMAHDEIDEPSHESYAVVRVRTVAYHERKFGVIFDRLRIAHHAAACAGRLGDEIAEVDGAERLSDVAQWVNRTVAKVLQVRIAA